MPRHLVLALTLAACRDGAGPPGKPCKRGATVEVRLVDNDSAYMKKLFAQVGNDRDGNPTDPAAVTAGIRADIDQWWSDEHDESGLEVGRRPTETDYYLIAADKAALEKYLAAGPPPPSDRTIAFERILPGPGATDPRDVYRTYLLVKDPVIDTESIADVKLSPDPVQNASQLQFVLTPEGKEAFAAATKKQAGKKIATMIDGVVTSAPIIEMPITGGRFSDRAESQAEADALLAKLACVK